MDKKSEKLTVEAEACAEAGESLKDRPIHDQKTLAEAISQVYLVGRQINKLEQRRKETNATAQKTIRTHTAWFRPLLARLEAQRADLRARIADYLIPGGELGNMTPEEIRNYGVEGVGAVSVVPYKDLQIDRELLLELHPELLVPNMDAIAELVEAGQIPGGVEVKTRYRLRIS